MGPNYRRYNELRAQYQQLLLDLEEARQDDAPGAALFAHDIRQAIHEVEHAIFLTGVSSEREI